MSRIVCKFGGSSVSTKENIEQIINILSLDDNRRVVVLSAPGTASGIVTKVTDYLIAITKKSLAGKSAQKEIGAVKARYHDIYVPLGLSSEMVDSVVDELDNRVSANQADSAMYRDAIVATGEEFSANLFAELLKSRGIASVFASPQSVNLLVTNDFGDARATDDGRKNLTTLKNMCEESIVVFPGFYGVTENGEVCTFSRGGSDLTGAMVADAIDAMEYENFTDVNGILAANPKVVTAPEQINALTYKEMRELSYMGFNVFHEEAVIPVMEKKIPIRLRNTNNIENTGTLIVAERLPEENDVIGIAGARDYCSFNIQKFLMNREKGFGRRLLSIFEDLDLSFEHCPSGVDNISVILDQEQLHPESVNDIVREIEKELAPDELKAEFGLSLISVVGEGLLHKVGVLGVATTALADAGINVKLAIQGSSELSITFGIDSSDEDSAVSVLYDRFFNEE